MKLSRILDHTSEMFNLNNTETGELSRILQRLVKGSLDTPNICSPILEKLGEAKVLDGWNSVFDNHKSEINDTLNSIEMNEKTKFGSRSRAKPWSDIKGDFLEFWNVSSTPVNLKPLKPEIQGRLRPWDLKRVISVIKNSTQSGLPFLVKKGLVKDKFLDEAYLISEWLRKYAAVPFIRTQEMLKTRVVWGIPIANIIYEGAFFYPFLEYQKKLSWRVALLGPDAVDEVASAMVIKAVSQGEMLVSMDFASYDRSLGPNLQSLYDEYKCSVFQPMYCDTILEIGERRVNISMITPDGLKSGPHGLPSGSADTNEAGSVIQATVANDTGLVGIGGDSSQFHGDDSIARLAGMAEVESYIASFERLKLEVNRTKTYIASNFIVFLQRLYHIDYIKDGKIGGIYSTYRALNRIMNFERFTAFLDDGIDGKDFNAIRTISILENCKFHPLFEEFVTYVWSLDKYNLKFSENGLSKYVEMMRQSEGTDGLIRNQYGTEVSGIHSFESFKIIEKLNKVG
uniref:RdRp n=1 Tax=viral metagenome TaxID=1070528 RepID=A0A2V0RBX3_9ZZZZ